MRVSVAYKGRLGNNLFQYAAARLFAGRHGGVLRSVLPQGCPLKLKTIPLAPISVGAYGIIEPSPVILTDKDDIRNMTPSRDAHYVLDGWFQHAVWYDPYREQMRSWFDLPAVEPNHDDIVMHVRLGDYHTNWSDGSRVIHPDWYRGILANERFRRLFIMTDDPGDPYLDAFDGYKPEIVHGSRKGDFHFMRTFARMIMSNSTFCWWAWFLGCGEVAYTFVPWVKDPQIELVEFRGAVPVNGGFCDGRK